MDGFTATALELLRRVFCTPNALDVLGKLARAGGSLSYGAERLNVISALQDLALIDPTPGQPGYVGLTALGRALVEALTDADAYAEGLQPL